MRVTDKCLECDYYSEHCRLAHEECLDYDDGGRKYQTSRIVNSYGRGCYALDEDRAVAIVELDKCPLED